MDEPVVLVTGATGAVGPGVVRAYQAAGYSVRTFSADAPTGDLLPSDVEVRVGDVCDARAVRSAVAGVDVAVHLAALLHQFENVGALTARFERVNIGGTENIVQAATAEGVKRLVFLSTIAVYGPSDGLIMDERTPPRPDTVYAETKLAAEQLVLAARTSGGPIGTVLRAAAVYGPRVRGNYRRLALAIARRRFLRVGSCLNRRTLVYERDLADAIVLAGSHPAAPGAVFNVTDGEVHTLAGIIQAICRALDRRAPRLYVPLAAARSATRVSEAACRMIGLSPPLSLAALDKYAEDVAVDGTRIRRALGFRSSVDLERGWRETMAVLRDSAE